MDELENRPRDGIDDYWQFIEEPFIKGLCRILILKILREGEKQCYHIYRYLRNKFGSVISLSTVHTMLKELTIRGFVAKVKNVYKLTEKGLESLNIFMSRYRHLEQLI